MPNTPLAYDRLFLDEAEWRFCVNGVAAVCRRSQIECRFAFEWPDYLGTQLLAACGHEHADAIVALTCEGLSYHGPWRQQEAELLKSVFQSPRSLPIFPFVARAINDDHLLARWDSARQFIDSGYCLGAACAGCGACANADERTAITRHARAPIIPPDVIENVARIEAAKRRLQPAYMRVALPNDFAGHSPAWVAARLMQTALTRHPELIDNLLAIDECLYSSGDNEDHLVIPAGETVVSLKAWDISAARNILAGSGAPFNAAPMQAPFAPGTFVRATWQLVTSAAPREAAQLASAWLNDLRLPHTLRRDINAWKLDLSPAAAKKKCVFSLSVLPLDDPQSSRILLTFAPKAALRDLLLRLPPSLDQPKALCTEIQIS